MGHKNWGEGRGAFFPKIDNWGSFNKRASGNSFINKSSIWIPFQIAFLHILILTWKIHQCTCAYQGVTNVSFSENFVYVLNGWPHTNFRGFFLHFVVLRVLISENDDLFLITFGVENFKVSIKRI